METIILLLFVCILLGCVLLDISILYALLLGYILFAVYSFKKGFSFKEIIRMSLEGVKTAKNILITFVLIGILTALWRAGGTIPTIVCYSVKIMQPKLFFVITFLLNALVSFLTGTSFGTAATIGAICVTMGHALELNPIMVGGAMLSGAFFGDRCSQVSTSALLVADLTKTDLYKNIKLMLKTAVVPFLLTCLIYTVYGFLSPVNGAQMLDIHALFAKEFRMNVFTIIPALLILILALCKIKVKATMLVSIVVSIIVCMTCQGLSLKEIITFSILGFESADPALSSMINGGGIISMFRVGAIVCISSSYSGIFHNTGLLNPVTYIIENIGQKLSAYAVTLLTSIATSVIVCNQTLAIMLTQQLCSHIEKDKQKLAIHIENSAVIVAPLVPWSIAGSVALASAGAPLTSLAASFYLILIPLWNLFAQHKQA